MGQKVNPIGLRLIRNQKWRSRWFANKQEFGDLLIEDRKIRTSLREKPACLGASQFKIRDRKSVV